MTARPICTPTWRPTTRTTTRSRAPSTCPIWSPCRNTTSLSTRGSGRPAAWREGGGKPCQVVINGENYHALEALAFAYAGKVDCIYIDPPYNTGAKDWKYNNDYVDGSDQYRHSKWLAFMERRLKLAKRLLNPADSVLIVTIDEKEYLRLGLLLEQVFPGERIQMVSINNNPAAVSRHGSFGRCDEYAYFVFLGESCPVPQVLNSEWITTKGRTHTGHIRWDLLKRSGTRTQRSDSPGCFYPIYAKNGVIDSIGEAIPPDMDRSDVDTPEGLDAIWPIRQNGTEGNWQLKPENLRALWKQGFVKLGKAKGAAATVYYLKAGERAKIDSGAYKIIGRDFDGSVITSESKNEFNASLPTTQWKIVAHDATQYGTRLLNDFFDGEKRFTYPKSLYAVEDCLRFFVADKPDALVVDFFSGSGTTAHAVMRLNHQDGGHRRSISVTNNEVGVEEAKSLIKAGYRQGDPEWEARGICEYITKPRIKAAITGETPSGKPIKGSYSIMREDFELDEEAQAVSKRTGKPIKRNYYVKKQVPDPSVRDQFPMADGFEENAVFYDLTYQDPTAVRLGMAFREVAPLLWLRAGARGRCIEEEKPDWDIADTYAVLFDPSRANAFVSELAKAPHVGLVYVVTDDERRFASVSAMLGGLPAVRLYADYLRSFRISAEGANN